MILLYEIYKVLFNDWQFKVSNDSIVAVMRFYEFIKKFFTDKVIYGIYMGFGPMTKWCFGDILLKDLQYNIIRNLATRFVEILRNIEIKVRIDCLEITAEDLRVV